MRIADFRQMIDAEQDRRRAHYDREVERLRGVGFGVYPEAPPRPMSEEERDAEAARRFAAWDAPEAHIKRRLLKLAEIGRAGAYEIVAACDRGDPRWRSRAADFLASA